MFGLWTIVTVSAFAGPVDVVRHNVAVGVAHAPGELMVQFDGGAQALSSLAEAQGCTVHHRFGKRPIYDVRCDPEREPEMLVEGWATLPGVDWVEASFFVDPDVQPDDWQNDQWHLANRGQTIDGDVGTPGVDISAFDAWDQHVGNASVVVAILDSGVYPDHIDLVDRMVVNPGEDCHNGIDDDGNGYIDDCSGWDAADMDGDANPLTVDKEECSSWNLYHGSFIAGLIGAAGDDDVGYVGVLWDVAIMPLKLIRDESCQTTSAAYVEATLYAIDNGADVMNMSFSSGGYSKLFEQALQDSDAAGMLSALSAGNDSEDLDEYFVYPKHYDFENRLIVANTTNIDALNNSSNWGSVMVDIAAPGTDMTSCDVDSVDDYRTGSGTSYSAPLVAGAFALVWSAYPELDAQQVMDAVIGGADPVANLDCAYTPWCVSTGVRLNLDGALTEAATIAAQPRLDVEVIAVDDSTGDGDGLLEPGEAAIVEIEFTNTGGADAEGVTVTLTTGNGDLTLDNGVLDLGTVPAGTTVSSLAIPDDLAVSVAEDCSRGRDAYVAVEFEDASGAVVTDGTSLRLWCADNRPLLSFDRFEIDDDNDQSFGDDDGLAELGELIELEVELFNAGDEANGVTAWLGSNTPYVRITDNQVDMTSIPAGGTGGTLGNDHDFDFEISPLCPDDQNASFDLLVRDNDGQQWVETFEVPLYCAGLGIDLLVTEVIVDDTDGDGMLEAGEVADILLRVENVGGANAEDVELVLVPSAKGLPELTDDEAWIGDVPTLASLTNRYDRLELQVDEACTDNQVARYDVVMTEAWQQEFVDTVDIDVRCDPDEDDDGASYGADCDDLDPQVYPGAPERCNGVDDDCDGEIDEDPADGTPWYTDADGDGAGDPSTAVHACAQPPGLVASSGDCDDGDAAVHPGGIERCNGVDDDCNELVDDDALDASTWYADDDGDGFGNPDMATAACEAPDGTVTNDDDCDDDDALTTLVCPSPYESAGCATGMTVPGAGLALMAALGVVGRRRRPTLPVRGRSG